MIDFRREEENFQMGRGIREEDKERREKEKTGIRRQRGKQASLHRARRIEVKGGEHGRKEVSKYIMYKYKFPINNMIIMYIKIMPINLILKIKENTHYLLCVY